MPRIYLLSSLDILLLQLEFRILLFQNATLNEVWDFPHFQKNARLLSTKSLGKGTD